MTQEQVAQLLQKYLDGQATPEELEMLDTWYDKMDAGTFPTGKKEQVASQMRVHIRKAIRQHDTPGRKSHFYTICKVAAVLFLVLGISFIWWKKTEKLQDAGGIQYVATGMNGQKQIHLPDGTRIILAPHSRLAYPKKFSSTERWVKLIEGDAFFDVVHEADRSFAVNLQSGLVVKVLGTSFRVHDVAADALVKVIVSTGKVAVNCKKKNIQELVKGQELQYHKTSGRMLVTPAFKPAIVNIAFNGSTLKEVKERLAYVYSINIQINDPKLLQLKCTANFNSGQPVGEILDILCKLHHLRFNVSADHKTFKIYK